MPAVHLHGCENGRRRKPLHTIALLHLIRSALPGTGLQEAHTYINQLVSCELVTLNFPTHQAAEVFAHEATIFGAVCTIADADSPGTLDENRVRKLE